MHFWRIKGPSLPPRTPGTIFKGCPTASLLCGFPVSASMQYFQAEQPRTLTLPTQIRMSSQQDASGDRLDCFWHFMMGTNNARSYCEKLLPKCATRKPLDTGSPLTGFQCVICKDKAEFTRPAKTNLLEPNRRFFPKKNKHPTSLSVF